MIRNIIKNSFIYNYKYIINIITIINILIEKSFLLRLLSLVNYCTKKQNYFTYS